MEGLKITAAVQDFDFMGGSLGVAAGEAFIAAARAEEAGTGAPVDQPREGDQAARHRRAGPGDAPGALELAGRITANGPLAVAVTTAVRVLVRPFATNAAGRRTAAALDAAEMHRPGDLEILDVALVDLVQRREALKIVTHSVIENVRCISRTLDQLLVGLSACTIGCKNYEACGQRNASHHILPMNLALHAYS